MSNPVIQLHQGSSGPTIEPSTPGYVLTVQSDGRSVAAAPGGTGVIDASEVVNDSSAPGMSVADALNILTTVPSFPPPHDNGNLTGAASVSVLSNLYQQFTLTGNVTLTVNDLISGRSQWGQFRAIQGAGGSHTLAIVGAKTPGSNGLTLSTAAGSRDLISWSWDGTELDVIVGGLAFG